MAQPTPSPIAVGDSSSISHLPSSSAKRISLLGAGNWGKNLARNFHELWVLTAIAEPSKTLRKSLAHEYPGVALHESSEAILADPSIQAVAIATPVPTHHAVASAAIAAGKDVFVEKPMTLTSAEAKDLVEKADSSSPS